MVLECKVCGDIFPPFKENIDNICLKCDEDIKTKNYKRLKKYSEENILKFRLTTAKSRAKKIDMDFDITLEYLEFILKEQNNKCAYTGLPFEKDNEMRSLSLDRIDSSKGYIQGNIQLVLSCINYMKQEYSEKDFLEMCKLVYLNSIH